jgi:hypothetical protein
LLKNKKKSLTKLAQYSSADNYRAGMISLTVKSIIEAKDVDVELLADIVSVLPVDQSSGLLSELEYKHQKETGKKIDLIASVIKAKPKLSEKFVSVVKAK